MLHCQNVHMYLYVILLSEGGTPDVAFQFSQHLKHFPRRRKNNTYTNYQVYMYESVNKFSSAFQLLITQKSSNKFTI